MANEFLPHAVGSGSNVISQAAWGALTARLTGFQAGVAKSNEVNKALRQSSSVAAMIGQFISDRGGVDALDDGDLAALLDAFETAYRKQATNYVATVGGSANALTVTLDPVPASYTALVGAPLRLVIANRNTGAVTLNVNGLGAKRVVDNSAGVDINAGELVVNAVREFIYDGSVFRLVARTAAYGNAQVFTSSGTFTVPPGVSKVKVTVVGGGGSGGSTGTSVGLAGGGGGAGGAAIKWVTGLVAGATIAVTVGAGGASQVGNAGPPGYDGNSGGTSSFGAYCSATGGNFGAGAISGNVGGGLGGIGTGGDVNLRGGAGQDGQSNATASGGNGGDGIFGGAGRASTGRSTVQDGGAPGAGGGSAYGSASTASGAGAAGLVIVEW